MLLELLDFIVCSPNVSENVLSRMELLDCNREHSGLAVVF